MTGPARRRRVAAAVLAATAAAIVGALALPAPGLAHGTDAPDATDYRTRVTQVAAASPGLTVRAIEAGARLELTNRTGRTIEVLGYDGEPYLEVRPDGVYENTLRLRAEARSAAARSAVAEAPAVPLPEPAESS